MTNTNLAAAIDRPLAHLLKSHHIELHQPQERMLQLNAVPLGPGFNKLCTNALLRQRPGTQHWVGHVDEDLEYLGENAARKALFAGPRRKGWLELTPTNPVTGDVNRGIVWLLGELDSPLRNIAAQQTKDGRDAHVRVGIGPDVGSQIEPTRVATGLIDHPLLARVGRWLNLPALLPAGFQPTDCQMDAALRTAETVTREWAPRCPLLVGPSGCGRSSIARLAADLLLRQGCVEQVLELNGAAIASGAIFWPERDERLRQTLAALESGDGPRRVLAIVEQFDLAMIRSEVATGLLCDALDAGLRLIAVARPEFSPKVLRSAAELRRRLEPVEIEPMPDDDTLEVVRRRWVAHPLANRLELAADVPRLVVSLAQRRPGAAPGAALGLLDAVARRAALVGQTCIGPDDVFHLTKPL